jgi:4-hydroxy-2-oxoheptanedioate aldolase
VRANDYLLGPMSQGDYVPFANEQTIVLPQIELMEAVKNLDKLVQVEGVDGFFVGPRDLSMSMGFFDGPNHSEVMAVINDVFDTVLGAGLVVGITAATGEDARALAERGVQIILGSVNGLLKVGASAYLRSANKTCDGSVEAAREPPWLSRYCPHQGGSGTAPTEVLLGVLSTPNKTVA